MTVAKSNLRVHWEHFNSKRPGHRITKCVLVKDEQVVDQSFVESQHQSKNETRKQSLNEVLRRNIGEKSERREVWNTYFTMRGRF